MRRIVYLGLVLVFVLVGCDSNQKAAPPGSRSPVAGCRSVVEWHGADYYGRAFPALPSQGVSLGTGGVPSCTDVLGGETGASRAVAVRRLVGVDPRVAIAIDGDRGHAYLARRGSQATLRP